MKTFIITFITENGSQIKERIDAKTINDAIRIFLYRTPPILKSAIAFNITKLQVN